MTEHPPRTVAIEYLRVEIVFGPLEDKVEQLFNVAFSFKDETPLRWDIDVRYSKFAELNKAVLAVGAHFVTTEFPKAHRSRAAFGMKLTDEKLEQRRTVLTLWFREVIANYDLLPQVVQAQIVDFMRVPPEYNLRFSTRELIRATSPVQIQTDFASSSSASSGSSGLPTGRPVSTSLRPSSSRLRNSFTQLSPQEGAASASEPSSPGQSSGMESPRERPRNNKVYSVHSLFHSVNELYEIARDACADLHTSNTTTRVLCIARNETIIKQSVKPIVRLFLEDIFSVYFFGYYFFALCVLWGSATSLDFLDGTLAVRLLYVSVFSLIVMAVHEQWEHHSKNLQIQSYNTPGFDPLQVGVNEFLPSAAGESRYREYTQPFAGVVVPPKPDPELTARCKDLFQSQGTRGALLKSFSLSRAFTLNRQKSKNNIESHIGELKSISRQGSRETEQVLSSNASAGAASASSTASDAGGLAPELTERDQQKAAKLAMRRAFDEFEFKDLSPAAKQMWIDRRFTHSFQVRGGNYLTDKKKIHPGSAMCKLMLLELFEVEPKDGDRHDHIAIRGKAKERREAIAALPGNPFQLIVNFQIPGDPPVSIVTYFAVPPDLADRFPEDEVAAFQSLFGRFINLPSNECERLATWGVVQKKEREEADDSTAGSDPSLSKNYDTEGEETSHASNASTAKSSWMKVPSDISWPDPHEPGALPPTDFRNVRFKLIPAVTEGPWVVKAAVRPQPALLGRKVVQRYFRGEGYMEVDIHVGSSVIASQVVGVCRGYGKAFAADVGIVIQGEDPAELPEKMLGCVSFNKIDVDVRQKLGG